MGRQVVGRAAQGMVAVARIKCEKIGEYEAPILQKELTDVASKYRWHIVVNFQDVQLLASVGLGLLITLHKLAKANKGKFVLFGLNDNLRGLLKMTKLDSGLSIAQDEASAVKMAG